MSGLDERRDSVAERLQKSGGSEGNRWLLQMEALGDGIAGGWYYKKE